MNGPRAHGDSVSGGRAKRAALAIALFFAACGGPESAATSSTGGEQTARPQRIADHETSAEPPSAVHAIAESGASDGPMAEPPPVEPPSYEAGAH